MTTDRYSYGAYGELEAHVGDSATPFLYNGRDGVMTDINGLYYMRARYNSPDLKRFINVDPRKGTISDSRTLNQYAYANGNPISYVDPFGTSAELLGRVTLKEKRIHFSLMMLMQRAFIKLSNCIYCGCIIQKQMKDLETAIILKIRDACFCIWL